MSNSRTSSDPIERLIEAARNVQFWTEHGTHNDGNLAAAKRELANAKRALKSALR